MSQWVPAVDGPRIVTIDIETFPNLSYHWGLWQQNIGLNQIVRNWSIASFCWKWLHEDKPRYIDCEANALDDRPLLARIHSVLDEADIVVGQNSKQFDVRKINARLIENGYPPPSRFRQIDTKVEAKKIAAFTSNKLEWLAEHLSDIPKDKHNEFPGFELWKECMAGNPRAWQVMRQYNPTDVLATEQVYLKLRPWIEGHPNVAAYNADQSAPACTKCGSPDLVRRGFERTQSGVYQRYRCQTCGGWSRDRYTHNTIRERRNLLAN